MRAGAARRLCMYSHCPVSAMRRPYCCHRARLQHGSWGGLRVPNTVRPCRQASIALWQVIVRTLGVAVRLVRCRVCVCKWLLLCRDLGIPACVGGCCWSCCRLGRLACCMKGSAFLNRRRVLLSIIGLQYALLTAVAGNMSRVVLGAGPPWLQSIIFHALVKLYFCKFSSAW